MFTQHKMVNDLNLVNASAGGGCEYHVCCISTEDHCENYAEEAQKLETVVLLENGRLLKQCEETTTASQVL